jgi:hypothetical protein
MASACRPLTAEDQVRWRSGSSEIFSGPSDTGIGLPQALSCPVTVSLPTFDTHFCLNTTPLPEGQMPPHGNLQSNAISDFTVLAPCIML